MPLIFDGSAQTITNLSVANTQVSGVITSGQISSVANTQVTGLMTSSQLASRLKVNKVSGSNYSSMSNGSNGNVNWIQRYDAPFPYDSGILIMHMRSLVQMSNSGGNTNNAYYYRFRKNSNNFTSGSTTNENLITNYGVDIGGNGGGAINNGFRELAAEASSSTWYEMSASIITTYNAGDTITIYASTDSSGSGWSVNEMQVDYMLITNIVSSTSGSGF